MSLSRRFHCALLCSTLLLATVKSPAYALPDRAQMIQSWVGPGVNHPEREWKFFETEHFRFHYYQGYAEFARFAAGIAESQVKTLASDLGVTLEKKIPVFITEDEFWNGFAEPLRTRIVLDPRFSLEPQIGLHRFMLHELTHILNFLAVESNAPYSRLSKAAGLPSWFAEGLAQYQAEFWAPEMDRLLRLNYLNDSLLTPAQRRIFGSIGRGADGYNEGYSLVKFMFDTYGRDKIPLLMNTYRGQNMSFEQAIQLTFGHSLLQLEAQWRDALGQRYRDQLAHRQEDIAGSDAVVPYTKSRTWYQPQVSPDGRWIAYQRSSGYPTIRGQIYPILPLKVTAQSQLTAYGVQQAKKAEEEKAKGKKDQEGQPEQPNQPPPTDPTPPDEPIENPPVPGPQPRTPFFEDLFGDAQDIKLKDIESEISDHAVDYQWRPDSQMLAYTTLMAKPSGNSTMQVQLQALKVEKDQLVNDKDPVNLDPNTTLHSPSWHPDGKTLAVVAEEDQRDRIVLYDTESRTRIKEVLVSPDLRQYRALHYSPDGQSLAFEAFLPGQGQRLMLLHLDSGELQQLTLPDTHTVDRDPVFAPDGQSLYFTSTRTGFSDLYRYDLQSDQLERLSQVYAGVRYPQVAPDGTLYYIRHHAQGTSLRHLKPTELTVRDRYHSNPQGEVLAQHSSSLTPVPDLTFDPQDYIPWIAPEVVVPVVGRDEKGDQLGFLAQFNDYLNKQAVNLLMLYGLASSRISFSTAYVNRFFDTSFGVEVADNPTLSFTTDGSQFFLQRDQHVSLFASRPLFNEGSGDTFATRIERFASLEFMVSRQSNLTTQLGDSVSSRQLREGFNNTLALSFSDDRSKGKSKGFTYSLGLSGATRFWGSEYEFLAANAEWRQYVPLWLDHQFAYQLSGAALTGESRPSLLGGPPLSNMLVLNFQNIVPLRGFQIAELQGPLMAAGSFEYRVPLLKPIVLNLGPHYIKNLNLAAFVDVGDAWYSSTRNPFPHVSTGLELRSDMILNQRNRFEMFFGVGKAMVSYSEDGRPFDVISSRPLEFYGGFTNSF